MDSEENDKNLFDNNVLDDNTFMHIYYKTKANNTIVPNTMPISSSQMARQSHIGLYDDGHNMYDDMYKLAH